MSGPTTVVFTAEPVTAILAAAAIRAAAAVQAGYREADALRDRHAGERDDNRAAQAAAGAAGQQALNDKVADLEQRCARLAQLAAPFGTAGALLATRPQPPAEQRSPALADYAEQLRALCAKLEAALGDALGLPGEETHHSIDFATLPESAVNAPQPTVSPTTAARLLARLADLGPLPEAIERLAAELAACTNRDRTELLDMELRRAIHLFEENAAREACAVVLEQTLKDLGYQVEPVSDTLFVDGGIVHFRRPGWDNYQVRLRLNADAGSANFNVIRAVEAGDNERSVLDHIAEDRWCAEFPALLQALAARGLQLNVTRRLAAGELPVQLVDRDKLPRFADEASRPEISKPLHKEIR